MWSGPTITLWPHLPLFPPSLVPLQPDWWPYSFWTHWRSDFRSLHLLCSFWTSLSPSYSHGSLQHLLHRSLLKYLSEAFSDHAVKMEARTTVSTPSSFLLYFSPLHLSPRNKPCVLLNVYYFLAGIEAPWWQGVLSVLFIAVLPSVHKSIWLVVGIQEMFVMCVSEWGQATDQVVFQLGCDGQRCISGLLFWSQ